MTVSGPWQTGSFHAWLSALLIALGALLTFPALAQVPFQEESPTPTEAAPAPIPAEMGEGPADKAIQARIASLFERDAALAGLSVSVQDGIVTLEGTVNRHEDATRALELADRVEGTIMVLNRLETDLSVASRFDTTLASLSGQFRALLALLPLLAVAAGIVLLGVFAARLVGRFDALYARVSRNVFLQDLVRHVVQVAVFLAGVVLALMVLDATALIGSIAGALGILGLAIGFATRDTVENYIASILLSLRQPFRRADFVRIDEHEGKVLRLTARATVLMSLEGNHVRVPNAKVFKATIVNYTRNPLRRFEFRVGVDTELDLEQPRRLALETLGRLPGVLDEPEPVCLVDALGDSSVILLIRAWVDQRDHDLLKVKSEAQRLVKEAFDDAGIVMPEPIYNVNLRRGGAGRRPPAPASTEEPGSEADTRPDDAVETQMREEPEGTERDLLDSEAPIE